MFATLRIETCARRERRAVWRGAAAHFWRADDPWGGGSVAESGPGRLASEQQRGGGGGSSEPASEQAKPG